MAMLLKNTLGNGLYSLAEAALYAKVSPQMLSRWLFGNQKGSAVVRPQFGAESRLVSFLDLIQALAIREIRLQKKVPLPKFRQAIKISKEKFGIDYPFARRHYTYLMGDELVISPADQEFVQASGNNRGQRLFSFVEIYLEKLDFSEDGLASLYRIYTCENQVPITMRPRVRFGEPMLPSGYSATAIWESIQAEGSIERAAKVYGIPKEEAEASYKFFVNYLGKAAA